VIVVSEESRQVSVAEEGRLRRRLSLEDLRTELQRVYNEQVMPAESPAEEAQSGV
jgi:hypothetical protein